MSLVIQIFQKCDQIKIESHEFIVFSSTQKFIHKNRDFLAIVSYKNVSFIRIDIRRKTKWC